MCKTLARRPRSYPFSFSSREFPLKGKEKKDTDYFTAIINRERPIFSFACLWDITKSRKIERRLRGRSHELRRVVHARVFYSRSPESGAASRDPPGQTSASIRFTTSGIGEWQITRTTDETGLRRDRNQASQTIVVVVVVLVKGIVEGKRRESSFHRMARITAVSTTVQASRRGCAREAADARAVCNWVDEIRALLLAREQIRVSNELVPSAARSPTRRGSRRINKSRKAAEVSLEIRRPKQSKGEGVPPRSCACTRRLVSTGVRHFERFFH